jgi:hypothetical protein
MFARSVAQLRRIDPFARDLCKTARICRRGRNLLSWHIRFAASVFLGVLLLPGVARAADPSVATITVTSATAGSSLSGKLVEGRMRFRDRDYVLTLRGVARSLNTKGSVFGLTRPSDIEGLYEPVGDALRNRSGVVIRFAPSLELEANKLEIEATGGLQPKVSRGQPGSGVER